MMLLPQESVRIQDLYKHFSKDQAPILKGVNVTFPAGQLTYLLGPSGVGKSVLLKHILGLLKPDQGEVWVGEAPMHRLNGRALMEQRFQFGMLFQNAALFDDFTVFENVAFPLREHTSFSEKQIQERVHQTLNLLGMTQGFEKKPSQLSGGMRKRVGLARAIIREPKILLYDEPTTGLDPLTRTMVDELIAQLKSDLHLTSIVISHDLISALLLADWIAFLDQGQILFWGTPKEFQQSDHPVIQNFIQAERRLQDAFHV